VLWKKALPGAFHSQTQLLRLWDRLPPFTLRGGYGNDRGAPGGNISTLEFGPNTTSLSSAGAPDHAVDMDLEVPPSPGFPLPSAVTLPSPATKAPQSHHAPSIIDYDLFAQGAQGTISNPSIVISRDYAQLPAPSLSAVRYGTLGFENYQDRMLSDFPPLVSMFMLSDNRSAVQYRRWSAPNPHQIIRRFLGRRVRFVLPETIPRTSNFLSSNEGG